MDAPSANKEKRAHREAAKPATKRVAADLAVSPSEGLPSQGRRSAAPRSARCPDVSPPSASSNATEARLTPMMRNQLRQRASAVRRQLIGCSPAAAAPAVKDPLAAEAAVKDAEPNAEGKSQSEDESFNLDYSRDDD